MVVNGIWGISFNIQMIFKISFKDSVSDIRYIRFPLNYLIWCHGKTAVSETWVVYFFFKSQPGFKCVPLGQKNLSRQKHYPSQIGLGLGRSFENYVLPSFCLETIHLSIVSTSEQVVLKSFVKETFKTARSSVHVYKKHKTELSIYLKHFAFGFFKYVPCKVHGQNLKESLAMIFSLLKMWN